MGTRRASTVVLWEMFQLLTNDTSRRAADACGELSAASAFPHHMSMLRVPERYKCHAWGQEELENGFFIRRC